MSIKLTILGVQLSLLVYLLTQTAFRNPRSVFGDKQLTLGTDSEKIEHCLQRSENRSILGRYFYGPLLIRSSMWAFLALSGLFLVSIAGDIFQLEAPKTVGKPPGLEVRIVDVSDSQPSTHPNATTKIRASSPVGKYLLVDRIGELVDLSLQGREWLVVLLRGGGGPGIIRVNDVGTATGFFAILAALACLVFTRVLVEQ